MPSFRALILLHGYAFLFWYVFAVQVGLPIPADPMLLIMGALIGDHHYSFAIALLVAVTAALCGDLLWYELGRRRGRSVLALLCKLSLEPDTCVRKTEVNFTRRGAWSLVFAKFIPGMSLISTPLAGAIRMSRLRFLLADAAGCALWCSTYLTVGVIFRHQIDELILLLGLYGRRAGVIIACLLAAFIAYRFLQRERFRRQLRINRVSPEEALALITGPAPVTIFDLRHPAEVEASGEKIAGAHLLRPAEVRARFHEIPEAHEVILYCT